MVKLRGPGLGQAAHGGLGRVLIFAETKGRAYCKKWHKPSQPNAPGQLAMRAAARFVAERWQYFTQAEKDSWIPLAAQTNIPPYNACLAYNLERARRNLKPTAGYPASDTGTAGVFSSPTMTAVGRQARFSSNVTTVNDLFGWPINKVASVGTPKNWNTIVHLVPCVGVGVHTFDYGPLAPGIHYFKIDFMLRRGWSNLAEYIRTVTIT